MSRCGTRCGCRWVSLVWPEVQWKPEWGTYRGKPIADEPGGHRIVDGGILANFPLRSLQKAQTTEGGVLGPFRARFRPGSSDCCSMSP